MDHATAVWRAKQAHQLALEAADSINVQVEPQAWPAYYRSRGRNWASVDPVDYRRRAP